MKKTISYGEEFFAGQKGLSYRSARQVIPIIQNFVSIRSVCDVGCGVGTWLRAFLEAGVQEVIGIDGHYVDKNLLEIPETAFYEADVRQPLSLNRTFNLAMPVEVAEHLPESRSIGFIGDLTRLGAGGAVFCLAMPLRAGQATPPWRRNHHIPRKPN
jgi:2-polyprenyl-3-methyl-5-hydroxy-6-metoxy-1,4-benzoquinol methylase